MNYSTYMILLYWIQEQKECSSMYEEDFLLMRYYDNGNSAALDQERLVS